MEDLILRLLNLKREVRDLTDWKKQVIEKLRHPSKQAEIAVVGKYITLQDAYKSIYEELVHGAIANDARLILKRVDSEDIEKNGADKYLKNAKGILVPGGFGYRGIEGKIRAIKYAREKKIPYFGICLGMQTAVIEFARNACGLKGANSTEFNEKTAHPVISLLEEQKKVKGKGGTMRLGAYVCKLKKGTKSYAAYKKDQISERHRHRYEFNNKYKPIMEKKGMIFAGIHPKGSLVEIVELKDHPWFVACQFHPEFKSKPDKCHPLFRDFIKAALAQ